MPESKRPLKVFLCHASTDKPKVRDLYRYLRKRGIQPWFDEEHLVGGQDWQVEIPKALATSDAIIICLTKNSVDKEGYIQKEIKFALDKALEMPEGRIFLIPVKFEECEVPFALSRYQWVDLTIEAGYSKMMKALKFRASQLERTTVEISKKTVEEEKLVLEKAEREVTEKAAREKQEQEAAEKARLEAKELAKQKAAKEKVEREAAQRVAREKAERQAAENAERERVAKEAREKQKRESAEKAREEDKPKASKLKARSRIVYWVISFAVLFGVGLPSIINNGGWQSPELKPTKTQLIYTSTSTFTKIPDPSETPTKIVTSTPKVTSTFTNTPAPTPTDLFLTFCTWQTTYDYKGSTIKYEKYEFNCNNAVCSGTRTYYFNNGTTESGPTGLWNRYLVNQRVQTEQKGKCSP